MKRKPTTHLTRFRDALFLAGLALAIFGIAEVRAEDSDEFDLDAADVIGQNLESFEGQAVTLRLQSGEDLTGIVSSVGRTGLRIKKLAGKELYEAVVRLDRINAILVRSDSVQKPKDAKDAKE
ncbi:MAG: hypothetical protein U0136_18980 [Bdellovibrionota bacterium]